MSKKKQVIGIVLILAMFLLACAPAAAPAPAPQAASPAPAPKAAPKVPVAPAKPAWEAEWEKTFDAAKKEGTVAFAISIGPATRRDLGAAFQNTFGLRAEAMIGTAGVIMSKILAERRAGLYLWDVMLAGGSAHTSVWKPGGGTTPLEPALILPDFTDPETMKKVWYEGRLPFVDRDRHMMQALLYVSPDVAINTNLVKPGEITVWDDFLNPKWKGKILLMDPSLPGTNSDGNLMLLLYEVKGEAWVRKLAAQEPVIIRDDRLAHDWLAHGKYPIYMPPRGELWPEYIKAGAPLGQLFPKDGIILTAGPAVVSLIDKAAHPNAAKIFINWVLGKEGMTIISKTREQQTPRLDVPTDFLPSYVPLRQPGVNYWIKDRDEVLLKAADYRAKSKEIFAPLLK